MSIVLAGLLGTLFYFLAAGQLFAAFRQGRDLPVRRLLPAGIGAVLLHGWVLTQSANAPGGFNLGLYVALSMMGWMVSVLVLTGSTVRPMRSLGMVAFPIGGLALALQVLIGRQHAHVVSYGWQMDAHIAIAMFSFAVLSLAAAQALMLATQERLLRSPGLRLRLGAMPPLETMEHLLFQLIGLGFALLTLTLITGVLFVDDIMGQALVHKTVLSFAAWLVFGALLWGRWRYGWRGRRAINMTLIGMGALVLAFFGSKFVLELVLGRG